jgi:tryptophanyl-tRNA synthetase
MITDPARVKKEDKGHPEVCSVYEFYKVFASNQTAEVAVECREARRGCVACKKELAEYLITYLKPLHEKRQDLECHPELIEKSLELGAEKARQVASQTLNEAKKAMGLK